MSSPLDTSAALEAASRDHVLPDAIYLFDTRLGDPIACVLWDGEDWAGDVAQIRWHTFSPERCGALNAHPGRLGMTNNTLIE